MFLLRGLLISASAFVVMYAGISALIAFLWWALSRTRVARAENSPALLYALRMAPLVVAAMFVTVFAVPAFLRFEPRSTAESIGMLPLVLSAMCAILFAYGVLRAWRASFLTSRLVRRWVSAAERRKSVAVFVSSPDAPPVALAGIANSTLLISASARESLTAPELECTIAHELAHLRARDNLKKLVLHACAFPGMASLERAWRQAIEISADSEAVHSESEALDLASALVKISRLRGCGELPQMASGLVDGPCSTLELRVQRLVQWTARRPTRSHATLLVATVFASAAGFAASYPAVLHSVHAVSELLVR